MKILHSINILFKYCSFGLPQVRKWSRKNKILQGLGNVRELYFESEKIDILRKIRENRNTTPLKTYDCWLEETF